MISLILRIIPSNQDSGDWSGRLGIIVKNGASEMVEGGWNIKVAEQKVK